MEFPRHHTDVSWDYDREADVLYLSFGEPRPAVGVDIGDGVVVRCDEDENEILGITVIGLRARLDQELTSGDRPESAPSVSE